MKVLHGREDINPDSPQLSFAAWDEYEGAAKILPGREDLSPDKPDNFSQTPLSCAAMDGYQKVVGLLQSQKWANP